MRPKDYWENYQKLEFMIDSEPSSTPIPTEEPTEELIEPPQSQQVIKEELTDFDATDVNVIFEDFFGVADITPEGKMQEDVVLKLEEYNEGGEPGGSSMGDSYTKDEINEKLKNVELATDLKLEKMIGEIRLGFSDLTTQLTESFREEIKPLKADITSLKIATDVNKTNLDWVGKISLLILAAVIANLIKVFFFPDRPAMPPSPPTHISQPVEQTPAVPQTK